MTIRRTFASAVIGLSVALGSVGLVALTPAAAGAQPATHFAWPDADFDLGYGQNGSAAQLAMEFKVPPISCTSTPTPTAPLIVSVLMNGIPVGSTGYAESGGFVVATCSGVTASYKAGLVMDDQGLSEGAFTAVPTDTTMTVRAGDLISVSGGTTAVNASPPSESYTITDARNAKSLQAVGVGMEAASADGRTQGGFPSQTAEWPSFKSVKFSAIEIDGAAPTVGFAYSQYNAAGTLQIKVNALNTTTDSVAEVYKTNAL